MTLYEPPYGPEDLREPPLAADDFLAFLQAEKASKFPQPPPFYQELCAGRLRPDDLRLWVKDQYAYWDHTLVYSTGAIFVKTNDDAVRTHILRKLVDLEGKNVVNDLMGWTTPAYEELWLRFGAGLGLARDEIRAWKPFTRTYYASKTLCMLSRYWEWSWLDGVTSLYAGDLYQQECLGEAYAALQRHYALPDKSLEFFRVYLADVATHLPWEQEALAYWCCTRERQLTAAKAFRTRLTLEHQLLLRLHTAVTSDKLPVQVP
jgi:pyrroloquinoline quinone (PQQ) biosynthesis protein C